MAGFGEQLRRERESRGISLEEISETTKICVRFLSALEKEEFSKLPGGIFTRSFIRSYAHYLGLDEESVIAEFQLAAPPKAEEDFSKLGSTGNIPKPKKRMPLFPWGIAVVLLGGGYAMSRYAYRATNTQFSVSNPVVDSRAASADIPKRAAAFSATAPQVLLERPGAGSAPGNTSRGSASNPWKTQPPPDPASPVDGPVQNTTEKPPPIASVIRQVAATTEAQGEVLSPAPQHPDNFAGPAPAAVLPAKGSGELVLQIAATRSSWIAVDADGKNVLESVLSADQVRTLTAKNSFDVTTGNAGGTTLTLNGVIMQPLGRQGEVKKVHLTRAYLKRSIP